MLGIGIIELGPTFNNRIHRTTLLTEPAVDALCHIDIVSCRPSAPILTLFGLNCDSLGRADSFTQFASDTPFFTGWVSTESVLATESGGDGTFFEGVVDGVTICLWSIPNQKFGQLWLSEPVCG